MMFGFLAWVRADDRAGLLAWALLPSILALVIFLVAMRQEAKGKPNWLKWISLVPLLIGVGVGLALAIPLLRNDELYRHYYKVFGKRALVLNLSVLAFNAFGAALVPLAANFLGRRRAETSQELDL